MAYGISKRVLFFVLALLALISIIGFNTSFDARHIFHGAKTPTSHDKNRYGQITTKVAVITDTNYTPRLIPLILHYHAVLGPEWPIILYTTQKTIKEHFQPGTPQVSAIWLRAIEDQRIQVRTVSDEFNLTSRDGVNIYMSQPWLWEQLAPAQHVLIFQADAMLCSNAHRTVDDFLQWDFIGAPMDFMKPRFNGGLSIRNRTLILDVLKEGKSWEEQTKSGEWKDGGEDDWFSRKLAARGAHLPAISEALEFAVEFRWNIEKMKEPLGYHKVHKLANKHMDEISSWCPEIALAAPGELPAA